MTRLDERETGAASAGGETAVVVVEEGAEHDDALAVRHEVFVEGQGVPEDLEVDGHEDAPGVIHFTVYDDGEPIGAARLRPYDEHDGGDDSEAGADDRDAGGRAKVERVAVVEDRRGEGWGARLMDAVEWEARERGFGTLVCHAQTHVEEFYAARGYETVGEEFEEAGIPHVEMRLAL